MVVRMANENSDWGYDRIVGAMANLGYTLSDQTVGNILQRHGILPAPERKRTTTWSDFIRAHISVLAGTDFFLVVIRKNSCGLRYQLYLSQHMHRCEQSHGIVGEGFKNLVVIVKTERFFVQNI